MSRQKMLEWLRPVALPLRLAYASRRHPWLREHLRHHRPFRASATDGMIDILVCIVDHFEPGDRHGPQAAVAAVDGWCTNYSRIAEQHRDADGRAPQHTWFYRAEYENLGCILRLSDECYRGLGEIEFHLHHGHDTHESFSGKLKDGLRFFNRAGAMISAEASPRTRFAYIAGNWSLDNGTFDAAKSGCNTELIALRDAGCFGDFTFPAFPSPAQPRKSNSIYYATDTPEPKSYDWGQDAIVGGSESGDLLLVQGPLVIDWRRGKIEDGAIESFSPPSPHRLDLWLKANVHVLDRPEWQFVKLHCHGMQSSGVWSSSGLDETFAAMCQVWNTPPFRLHFVTAREAYNIVKAAMAGKNGDPNDYRDFEIAPPANRLIHCTRPWNLRSYAAGNVSLSFGSTAETTIGFREGAVQSVSGEIRELAMTKTEGNAAEIQATGNGSITILESGQLRRCRAVDLPSAVRQG